MILGLAESGTALILRSSTWLTTEQTPAPQRDNVIVILLDMQDAIVDTDTSTRCYPYYLHKSNILPVTKYKLLN